MARLPGLRRRAWLVALSALPLAACAGVPGVESIPAPEVQLADLAFGAPGLLEQELEAELRITNFADRELDARGLRLTVWLAGERFGRGVTDRAFTLPALGEARVRVPLYVATTDLLDRLAELARGGRLDYRIEGDILLGGPFGEARPLPFSGEGRIRLPRLPFTG